MHTNLGLAFQHDIFYFDPLRITISQSQQMNHFTGAKKLITLLWLALAATLMAQIKPAAFFRDNYAG